ncbi:hypothetical protein LCGC14_1038820 [marine sediment metagenome]|uniref:YspA cpYpsA-related SLOG domain-containing protein n=1 Tax=marine sediment metagenome TaxID=412755 RepID=A0A0F9QAM9_9ZZZZ
MKLVIAGSRDFEDYELLKRFCLIYRDKITEIVSGCARGADLMGEKYAKEIGIPVKRFPANWNKYGKSAGMIRNKEMMQYGDHLIAFWDSESRGTAHIIGLARDSEKEFDVIHYKNIIK